MTDTTPEAASPTGSDAGVADAAASESASVDSAAPAVAEPASPVPQSSLAAPRGLSYAVDIVFCIDVTGSMNPILDAVKANALGFYDDVQTNLTEKGKNVAQLRVRVVAFRDLAADGAAAVEESPFYELPADRGGFSEFVNVLGLMGSSSKRLILFAPDGPGWSDISAVWENVVHNPSTAGGGLSEVDYGTIIDSIGNSV